MDTVFAVALLSLRTAVRRKTWPLLGLVAAAGILLLDRGTVWATDPQWRLTVFLNYAHSFAGWAVGLGLTLVSCSLLRGMLENRRTSFMLTKPVPRGHLILGVWLSVGLMALATLAACEALISLLAVRQHQGPLPRARAYAVPLVEPEVDRTPYWMLAQDETRQWRFAPIPAGGTGAQLRMRFQSPSLNPIDPHPFDYRVECGGRVWEGQITGYAGVELALPLPPETAGAASGPVISYTHRSSRALLLERPTVVLTYPVAPYAANAARWLVLSLLQTAFFSMAALFWSSFLTFPVALSASLVYWGISACSDTIRFLAGRAQVFGVGNHTEGADGAEQMVATPLDTAFRILLKGIHLLSARAGEMPPASWLADGRLMTCDGPVLSILAGWCLLACLLGLLGSLILRRCEAARLDAAS